MPNIQVFRSINYDVISRTIYKKELTFLFLEENIHGYIKTNIMIKYREIWDNVSLF